MQHLTGRIQLIGHGRSLDLFFCYIDSHAGQGGHLHGQMAPIRAEDVSGGCESHVLSTSWAGVGSPFRCLWHADLPCYRLCSHSTGGGQLFYTYNYFTHFSVLCTHGLALFPPYPPFAASKEARVLGGRSFFPRWVDLRFICTGSWAPSCSTPWPGSQAGSGSKAEARGISNQHVSHVLVFLVMCPRFQNK